MTRRRVLVLSLAPIAAGALLSAASPAIAQRFDPRRATTLTVGAPRGAAPTAGGDARRTGRSRERLPESGPLRVAWRRSLGLTVDHAALAIDENVVAAVAARGDVVFLDGDDGDELVRVPVGAGTVGPATATSDGTVVFLSTNGDVIGVRRDRATPRFVRRVASERAATLAAPLGLADGGAVLATTHELIAIDAEGGVRARAAVPEPPAAPLLSDGARVLSISGSGAVRAWTPGGEPVRVGSFGAAVDGGATLLSRTTLLAVVEGNHLAELDLTSGARTTRAIATQGLYLGPPSARRAAAGSDGGAPGVEVCVLALTASRVHTACVEPDGHETRSNVGRHQVPQLPDGGVGALVAPPHAAVLVDDGRATAFATPTGEIGVVTPQGAVEVLGENPCPRTGRSGGVAGLTAAGRAAFYVTCESGTVVKVTGPGAPAAPSTKRRVHRPPPAASGPPPPRVAPDDPPDDEPEPDLDEP